MRKPDSRKGSQAHGCFLFSQEIVGPISGFLYAAAKAFGGGIGSPAFFASSIHNSITSRAF